MRKYKFIFATFAATAALSACTKEITPPNFENDKVNPAAEGTRVISVSFAPQTKTNFNETAGGIEPYFEKGDEIVLCSDIANPTADNTETCTVTEQLTITTKLTGALTAYYPADYVKKGDKLGLCIPANQSGEFKDANFVATIIADGATSATFKNVSALFRIIPPAGTKKLTVKSLCEIGSDGQRSGDRRSINDEGETDQELCSVVVGDGTTDIESPCYVALSPGVNLSDLSFEATSDAEGTTGFIKGIPTSAIAAQAGTGVAVGSEAYNTCNTVAEGAAYTIDDSNWHGYVIFAGHKWATMNIGANAPEEYGDYFAWGDTVGHSLKSNWKDNYNSELRYYENVFKDDYAFTWSNCPFTNGVYSEDNKKVFTKYLPEDKATEYGYGNYSDSKTVLDLCDDAAYVKWGGAWRMPTKKEFDDFLSQTDEYNDGVNNGCFYFNSLIKIPVSGGIYEGTGLFNPTEVQEVYLWSSSLWASNPNTPVWATDLSLNADTPDFNVWCRERYAGAPIRAIVDDPDYSAMAD